MVIEVHSSRRCNVFAVAERARLFASKGPIMVVKRVSEECGE